MGRVTPLLTSRKVLTFTYPDVQETTITPETLPTTEPADPQIVYTVAQADLAQLNFNVFKRIEVAILNASGQAVTAATISYRMTKNGVSVRTGTYTVAANYYYRLGCYFYDVAVGDVLGIKLWSSVADSNWDMKTFWMNVTRVIPFNKPRWLYNADATSQGSGSTSYWWHNDAFYLREINFTVPLWCIGANYGMFRVYRGDINPNSEYTTGTTRPARLGSNYVPSQIIFRGLRID